jgi:hypothetical protein
MPLEVTCGHCQGDIVVEAAGVTVACPLCGSHLEIPDLEGVMEVSAAETPAASPVDDATAILTASTPDLTEQPTVTHFPSEADEEADWTPQPVEPGLETTAAFLGPAADAPDFSTPDAEGTEAHNSLPTVAATTRIETPAPVEMGATQFISAALRPTLEATSTLHTEAQLAATHTAMVPWNWFLIAASYSSATTLVLLYLFFTSGIRRQHALESLPDLVPKTRRSEVSMEVPPPESNVAPGHVLRLGDTQRFGSLKLTPVKITRGPLMFAHAFKQNESPPEPSEPVFKLWLKFENVSEDQVFPPLDRTLVYKRIFTKKKIYTNNFLCAAKERRAAGNLFYVYDMPEFSEFVIVGQDLDRDVKPGETWDTFIPSQDGIVDLHGDCVWRVQFRKGYHAGTGRGVTTLVDVKFDPQEIVDEEAGPDV